MAAESDLSPEVKTALTEIFGSPQGAVFLRWFREATRFDAPVFEPDTNPTEAAVADGTRQAFIILRDAIESLKEPD